MSQALRWSSSVCTSPISAIKASKSASGSPIAMPSSSIRVCELLDVGDGLFDVLQHRLALGERRLLQQDADAGVLGQHDVTVVGGLDPGHQLEQRRLTGAVGSDHADLGAGIEGQGDVVQHDLVTKGLADVVHRVDELRHGWKRGLCLYGLGRPPRRRSGPHKYASPSLLPQPRPQPADRARSASCGQLGGRNCALVAHPPAVGDGPSAHSYWRARTSEWTLALLLGFPRMTVGCGPSPDGSRLPAHTGPRMNGIQNVDHDQPAPASMRSPGRRTPARDDRGDDVGHSSVCSRTASTAPDQPDTAPNERPRSACWCRDVVEVR